MFKQYKISVIIPTYNRYELLCHAVRSVLNGTYKNVEIIIVNDCSTDVRYYSGVLERFERTKVYHLPVNMGILLNKSYSQGATRQIGIDKATGEFIAFLDDDDMFEPDKLEVQMRIMAEHNCPFSCTNMIIIHHHNINDTYLDYTELGHYFTKEFQPELTKKIINDDNLISLSTVIIHKSLTDKHVMLAEKYEDKQYWLRILDDVPYCLYINKPLVKYAMNNPKYYNTT